MRGDKLEALLQGIYLKYGVKGLLTCNLDYETITYVRFPFRGDSIQVRLSITDSMYSFAKIDFLEFKVPKNKQEKMRSLLNDFNMDSSDLTFYLAPDEGITARLTYTTNDENFDPYFFLNYISKTIAKIDLKYYDRMTSLIKGV